MTRLQRLVLDAVEKHGPDATTLKHIFPYVSARRWMFSRASIYLALRALEDAGHVTHREEMDPARRGPYPRYLYSVTNRRA